MTAVETDDQATRRAPAWGEPALLIGLLVTAALVLDSFREKVHRIVDGAPRVLVSPDLTVYQDGARAWLDGAPLVGPEFVSRADALPFTYPPFAAILFTPLAPLPVSIAALAWHTLLLGCAWLTLWAMARALDLPRTRTTALALLGLSMLGYPFLLNLHFGQINLVLYALVVVDLVVVPPRYRGLLIGLAAGIKITPFAFVAILFFRREWWAIARSVAALAATIGLGWLVLPGDSRAFWTDSAWDTARAGAYNYQDNESITGALGRAGMEAGDIESLFPWLSAPLIVLTLLVTWGLLRAGRTIAAIGVLATGLLVCEPVGWLHHGVLSVLVVVVLLVAPGHRDWRPALVALFLLSAFAGPRWFENMHVPPGTALPWWRQIVMDSPMVGGILAILVAGVWCVLRLRAGRRAPAATTDTTPPETAAEVSDPASPKQVLG